MEYHTLSEGINSLRKEGYTEDFNLKQDCIECGNGKFRIFQDEFRIDKVYRYEGDSNPDDESVLYAISSDKHNIKGILVNAYGIYSEDITDEMLSKLKWRGEGQ